MKRQWQSIERALGARKYVLIGSALGVAAVYEILRATLTQWIALPDLPSWQIAIVVILLIVLWTVLNRTVSLEDSLEPRFAISDAHVDPALEKLVVPSGQVTEHRANYVHVVLTSLSEKEIEDCRAFLMSAKQIWSKDEVINADFKNPIQLVSASRHEQVVTLSPRIPQHFDLVYATSRTNMMDTSPALLKPNLLGSFFQKPGTYVLHVAVSGKGAPTAEADIEVTWTKWDDVTARIL